MPLRKRRCTAQSDKQKKLITSRLMEISLKVDDYIYKNKTIADNDAVNYIQEVASYKTLCSNDERCLQVIEKLTRIMKGIIAEQQETTAGDIFNENYTFETRDEIDGSISPVYSIPDEDRTQCTQVIPEGDTDNVGTKTDKEIIDLCDSEDENSQEDIPQGISSIIVDVELHRGISDLSINPINEDSTQMTSINNECSQSILKHFENVEINEENQVEQDGTVQVTSSNHECSQSILKNIDTNTELLTRYENVIRTLVDHNYAISVDKTTKPVVRTNTPRNTKVATVTTGDIPKPCNNLTLTIDTTQITTSNIQIEQADITGINAPSTNNITPSYTQNITNYTNPSTIGKAVDNTYQNTNIHDESHNKNAFANNATDNPSSTFPALNKNGSRNDNCKANTIRRDDKPTKIKTDCISKDITQTKKKNTVNVNKKHKPEDARVNAANFVKPTDIKDNKTKPSNNPTTTKKKLKKKSEGTPEKKDKITFKKPPAKKTAKNKVKQPNKIIQIYNNNTENDLSWMENIRFVREINENEYDSQLKFEDDFWDNYSIPGLWDDQDFNY